MIIPSTLHPTSNRIVHLNDCFWCVHHQEQPLSFQKGKLRVREICGLDQHRIPEPFSGQRWCEDYIEKNCPCNICVKLETGLDK